MSDLRYLYAILTTDGPAVERLAAGTVVGIDDQPVAPVVVGTVAAAVSAVTADAFDAEPLNRLVRDMAWLAPRAARHQEVNAWLFDHADALLPIAFGTVYRGLAGVEQLLQSDGAVLQRRLAALRGKAEWVATLECDAETARAAVVQQSRLLRDMRQQIADGSPGRAYLLSRRFDAVLNDELVAHEVQAVHDVTEQLSSLAVQTFREEIAATGNSTVTARVSLLVERSEEATWRRAVDDLRDYWQPRGYVLRVTGPWPAYRFTSAAGAAVGVQ